MIKSYFRNAGILGLTEILLSLKGLILLPILTKHFGTVNYGIWAQVSVLVGVLSPLMVMGTNSAMVRFLPGKADYDKRRGLTTVLLYIVFVSIIIAIFLMLMSRPLATAIFDGVKNARFVAICGAVIFVNLILNVCRNWYRIGNQAKIYSFMNITQSMLGTGAAVCVVITKSGIFKLVLLMVFFDAVLAGVSLTHIGLCYGWGRPNGKVLYTFIRFGLPLMPGGYAMWVLNASDRFFIVHYGTLADIGVYSVVYSFGYIFISMFFNPIHLMYPPRASELYNVGDLKGLNQLFRYCTKGALGLLVPVIVGFSVLSKPIFRIFTTEEFLRGASLVPIVTSGYTFHMLSTYFSVNLGLAHKTIWPTINLFIAAAFNILFNVLLIPRWGITGAAIATSLGFALQMVLSIWKGMHYVPLRFDWMFLIKAAAASALMAMVIGWFQPDKLLSLSGSIALGILVYGFGMLLLRAATPEEIEILINATKFGWLRRFAIVNFILGFNTDKS